MDEKARLGIRNWDFSEQTVGVPYHSGINEHPPNFLRMNTYYNRNSMTPEVEAEGSGLEYGSHVWVHQRNFLSATRTNPETLQSTQINTETGLPAVPISMFMPTNGPLQTEELGTKSSKVRKQCSKSDDVSPKRAKPKQPKKQSHDETTKKKGAKTTKHKKNVEVFIDGNAVDFSQLPVPVCSCTGAFRQCYRWGAGGWQSSCCTNSISEYPLPMSSSRPGARVAGRKMSNGAYGKLLQRLAAEGYDLSDAVDLKDHWAKHGTNKFVTIK
ncbi:hypothetical protein ACHQM5_007917 [Ranunculus cassubicifolius]